MAVEGAQGQVDVRRWAFAGPVERAYELSRAPTAMIVGPTGGGKSTGSARRCLRVATWQHPSPRDGVRKARVVCICPTYRRAWDTVMPSYFKVLPQSRGVFRGSRGDPADHILDLHLPVGGVLVPVHLEVLFRAVNDLDIEDFFRGFEFTAVWLPEADTNGDLGSILSLGSNRAGRYPEPEDRPENPEFDAYTGIFGDANAPMIGMPFHNRFYLKKLEDGSKAPATDKLFIQPGGLSDKAENMANLRKIKRDYYGDMASKLDAYDVGRLIDNKPGPGRHGQAVHPNFDYQVHVAARSIEPDPLLEVFIGVDAGSGAMIPGATFGQRGYSGQWRTFAEIYLADGQMGTEELARSIRQILNSRFGACKKGAMICIDPAAASRNPMSEYTTAQALQHFTQIEVQLAPSNDPKLRRSAIDKLFKASAGPGVPMKLIDPDCVGLIQGYSGGFHYKKRNQQVALEPAKNRFSHVCEADEYTPLTVDGIDAREGRFIRPGGSDDYDAPIALYD